MDSLKFPIGKYQKPENITRENLNNFINDIETFPTKLRKEVENLTNEQLDTPYRPEGWTIRQVVNHCADSHMNSLTRLKLALTEDQPTIKPYYEEKWAELADSKNMPIEPALKMLEGIHQRWTILLRSLNDADFKKKFIHPEHGKVFQLDENTGLYAWHCNHHLAHITTLKKSKEWK
jgi:hypothetical protein